jgi:hypothetical protein
VAGRVPGKSAEQSQFFGGRSFDGHQVLEHSLADSPQLLELLNVQLVEQVRAHTLRVHRGGGSSADRPSSVSTAMAPRRSVSQASRRIQPSDSSRAMEWDSRLRDDWDRSARSLIRCRPSGTSASGARTS